MHLNTKLSKINLKIAAVVVVALGASFLLYANLFNPDKLSKGDLKPAVISVQDGGKINFLKPESFVKNVSDSSSPIEIYFQKDKKSIKGYLGVGSIKLSQTDLVYYDEFNDWLSRDSSNKRYQDVANIARSYTGGILLDYNQIKLGRASKFNSPKIKSDAWTFDFTAQDGPNGNLKGKTLYAWTDKAVYFVVIAQPPSIWEQNQTTWQEMLNQVSIE